MPLCGYMKLPGASRTPPPISPHVRGVGANSVRPCNLVTTQNSAGEQCSPRKLAPTRCGPMTSIGPYRVGSGGKFGPGGVNRRRVQKRQEKCSTPAFFSFWTLRPHYWGFQGAGPLGRGSLPRNSETFFASFFGHKKGRFPGRSLLKKALPQGRQGR